MGKTSGIAAAPSAIAAHQRAIRQLRPSELPLFRDHLLRLDARSRHCRFGYGVSDAFVAAYADRSFTKGALVIGYLAEGVVKAAAELHERPGASEPTGEIAFTVDADLRRHGIGGRLFARLIAQAEWLGYAGLRFTIDPDNRAMQALAKKFGTGFVVEDGELIGLIKLGAANALAA